MGVAFHLLVLFTYVFLVVHALALDEEILLQAEVDGREYQQHAQTGVRKARNRSIIASQKVSRSVLAKPIKSPSAGGNTRYSTVEISTALHRLLNRLNNCLEENICLN